MNIHHKNKSSSVYQMDMLIDYAKRNKGIPVYLLYNFYSNYKRVFQIEEEIGLQLAFFGCSIISADYLKANFPPVIKKETQKNAVPTFEDLHPYVASPFQNFVNDLQGIDIKDWLFENNCSLNDVRFYTKEELNFDKLWEDMAPLPAIGFVIDETKEKELRKLLSKNSTPFNPRFRLVFPIKRRQGVIIRYS